MGIHLEREGFQQLCELKVQFGRNNVQLKYSANPKLRQWIARQCHHYKLYLEGTPSGITAERTLQLESIEFVWRQMLIVAARDQLYEYKGTIRPLPPKTKYVDGEKSCMTTEERSVWFRQRSQVANTSMADFTPVDSLGQ